MADRTPTHRSRYAFAAVFGLIASFLVIAANAQQLPSEIRGYKVHRQDIVIADASDAKAESGSLDAFIKIGEPELTDVSLTGMTLEIPAEIKALQQSGKVDFLTFHDFRVNGISVNAEEYAEPFSFRKNEAVTLPKPARVFLPTTGILKSAWKEMKDSSKDWTITGRVFVFGKFRKMGFSFKRVVPIDISITIRNPLRQDPA
jgi:hypothetical protein